MKDNNIVRLLMLDVSQNDAEATSNLFRNCGFPTRAHRLERHDELPLLLAQEEWDLLIASDDSEHPQLSEAINVLEESQTQLPVLLVTEDVEAARPGALETGVREVIAKGDHQHLLHAAMREVNSRRALLESLRVREKLDELQARYELLMGGSQDAIAYITDGMHVDVNEAYAHCFGYADTDELECMPVIDLIAQSDQDKFKEFLRAYSQGRRDANNRESATLDIATRHQDGTERELQMVFAPASYEGEACTQIVIRAGAAATAPAAASTGSRQFISDMHRQLTQCQRQGREAALIYLQLSNLLVLRDTLGVFRADQVASELHALLGSELPAGIAHGRVSNDGFVALMTRCSAKEALRKVEAIQDTIHQHFFDVEGRTTRCESVATVMALGKDAGDNLEDLIDCTYAGILDLLSERGDRRAAIYKPPAAPIQMGNAELNLDSLQSEGLLRLLYQPVVSLRGDAGEYYEMTAVLQDADGSELDCKQLAAGMLDDRKGSKFDRWLLFNATKQLAAKRADGTDTRLIVNVSPSCLRDGDFCNWLGVSLSAAGLPPVALSLQLDESDVKVAVHQAGRLFSELNKLGCGTGLNNFGSFEDSAEILKHSGAKAVKVRATNQESGVIDDKNREALKRVLNETVPSSTTTIVSHVASAATLATLWQLGASFIQGSYLQGPAPEMAYEFAEIA